MTLIEVMIALVILSLILVPLASSLGTGLLLSGQADHLSQATALAQQEMERLLAGIDRPLYPTLSPDGYTVNSDVTSNGDGTEKICVTVSWEGRDSQRRRIQLVSFRR